jgi:MFS family permease
MSSGRDSLCPSIAVWRPSAFLILDRATLLVVFMLLFTMHAVASGVAGLPLLDVVLKTSFPRRRGMYLGWRRLLGGILALAAAGLITWVLSEGFPLASPGN